MWEWTTEIGDHKETETVQATETTEKTKPIGIYTVSRGGSFYDLGEGSVPVTFRYGNDRVDNYPNCAFGFRPVLYLK